MDVEEFYPNREEKFKPLVNRFAPGWGKWIDVSGGWDDLIVELDKKLAEIDPDYVLHQCKEKFGGLRYYTAHHRGTCDAGDNESYSAHIDCNFSNLIRQAEAKSFTICEECGKDGTLREGGWIRTLCDQCELKRQERLKNDNR